MIIMYMIVLLKKGMAFLVSFLYSQISIISVTVPLINLFISHLKYLSKLMYDSNYRKQFHEK